jgi:hypothetical protein
MKKRNPNAGKNSRTPDVAAQRRISKRGQLRHNVEKPAEENRDAVPPSRKSK